MKKKDAEDKKNTTKKKGNTSDSALKTKKTSKRAHIVFDDVNVSEYEWDFDLVDNIDKTINENINAKKSDSNKSDAVADVEEPVMIEKSDDYNKIASVEDKLPALPEKTSHDIAPVSDFAQKSPVPVNYVMPDAVIEKYTKYPLDDYYAAYYDTLRSGKKYRGFSWKAFFFNYYWAAFRLISNWMVFAMICVVGLLIYSIYGIALDETLVSKSMLNDLKHLNINIFPFSKTIFGVFIGISGICLLFIGFVGDFIYAKYGVLARKYKWSRKDIAYEACSGWRVVGAIIACKLLFWASVIVSGVQHKLVIPSLVCFMCAVSCGLLVYLIYDFFLADPKKLALQIGAKSEYIYATSVKSEGYFTKQFRKYERIKKCEFNWCAALFTIPYFAGKGCFRMCFLALLIFIVVSFGISMADTISAEMLGGRYYSVFISGASGILLFFVLVYFGLKFNSLYYCKVKQLAERGTEIKKFPRILIAAIIWMLIL